MLGGAARVGGGEGGGGWGGGGADLFVVDVHATHAEDDGDGVGGHEGFRMHLFRGGGGGGGKQQPLFFVNLLADTQRLDRVAGWQKPALHHAVTREISSLDNTDFFDASPPPTPTCGSSKVRTEYRSCTQWVRVWRLN